MPTYLELEVRAGGHSKCIYRKFSCVGSTVETGSVTEINLRERLNPITGILIGRRGEKPRIHS